MLTIRDLPTLAAAGLVPAADVAALEAVAARYAVALTPDLMAQAADHPAIAAQFVPHRDELADDADALPDPIGDAAHSPVPGIVHRYPDRVLLKLVQVCAVYCRFCFRREVVGPGEHAVLPDEDVERALAYIAADPAIWEVILTGGDPLVLSPRRLGQVMARLGAMSHVKVVRLHSRVPVVAPARIDASLVAALKRFGRAVFVAVHANAAAEFTPTAEAACGRLVDAGIPLVGQTVLLAGVNDTPAALEALMRRMVEIRIKPYYLHHADLAPGTRRFRTSIAAGQSLTESIRGRVSGLAQPTYVLDIPGGAGKVPLSRSAAAPPDAQGRRIVTDRHGSTHLYPDIKEAADNSRHDTDGHMTVGGTD